jgi:hypothetical protein
VTIRWQSKYALVEIIGYNKYLEPALHKEMKQRTETEVVRIRKAMKHEHTWCASSRSG